MIWNKAAFAKNSSLGLSGIWITPLRSRNVHREIETQSFIIFEEALSLSDQGKGWLFWNLSFSWNTIQTDTRIVGEKSSMLQDECKK